MRDARKVVEGNTVNIREGNDFYVALLVVNIIIVHITY